VLSSILIDPTLEEIYNHKILDTWYRVKENEIRYKEYYLDDAEYVVVGFGTAGRIALTAVRNARLEGIKVGLFRPISVSPFPFPQLEELVKTREKVTSLHSHCFRRRHPTGTAPCPPGQKERLVEAHGGRIWAESQVKKGSTFTIELPLEEAEKTGANHFDICS
jgi:hypothetical protein